MKTLKKVPYSYILMEDDEGYILTFLKGGVAELDVTVRLNSEEMKKIENEASYIDELVKSFLNDSSLYSDRMIFPTIWPGKN
ncbi:MAG: hypothetical protein VX447_01410 [Pseudomonadota bacterium]|nr:hypothetical protein [Pseudomonadota bacterium]